MARFGKGEGDSRHVKADVPPNSVSRQNLPLVSVKVTNSPKHLRCVFSRLGVALWTDGVRFCDFLSDVVLCVSEGGSGLQIRSTV